VFPFTLNGPFFLLFYAGYATLLVAGLWLYRRSLSAAVGQAPISELADDPYKIAFLRGGDDEMIRVAIVNLLDCGLLCAGSSRGWVRSNELRAVELVSRPLDRALLNGFSSDALPSEVRKSPEIRRICDEYRQDLVRQRLALDATQRRRLSMGRDLVLALIAGVAIARIMQAVTRGQSNILLLLVLAAVACWGAYHIGIGEHTSIGRQALNAVRSLMMRLKIRAGTLPRGGSTNEAVLLAAAYGIYTLPATSFPFVEETFPKPWWSRREVQGTGFSGDGGSGSGCGGGGGGCGGCGGGD
jgi:uncharacterized protein (TIGR04222 family)